MYLKIYFAGSIDGGRQDAGLYERIEEQLKKYGQVLTEAVASPEPAKAFARTCQLQKLDSEADITDKLIHDQDMDWLKNCDVVVAEVTQTSHGVGYELGQAVALNKKVLCLFRPHSGKKLSSMIRGAENGTAFICKDYKEEDMPDILKNFFESLQSVVV